MDADRRARLLGVALRTLVEDRTGTSVTAEVSSMGRGVALLHDHTAWVLVDDRHQTALGPALAWSLRHGVTSLQIMTPQAAGVLARRASGLRPDRVTVEVWQVRDRHQSPATPTPLPAPAEPAASHLALAPLIQQAGADLVVEHGVVAGEVVGLEVCRVVTDPDSGAVRLEVGVGVHDREAFGLLHGEVPVAEALARVVESVAQHRRRGAPPHPLNRLARERLICHRLSERPEVIGLSTLRPAPPPLPRTSLKDPVPCVARAVDADGHPVVVVCSHGIDLDVVPYALDARTALDPTATVVVAVDGRDAHPLQHRLAELATGHVRVVSVPDMW